MGSETVESALEALAARGETLAVAESLTGGRLASAVTAVPGCSRVFVGGVVSYATRLKVELLGVPASVVEADGVVSVACAASMADGVRRRLGATWGIATTGVAGPGPSDGVAAGTVYVAVSAPSGTVTRALRLSGTREEVCGHAVTAALALWVGEAVGKPGGSGSVATVDTEGMSR